MKQFGELSKEDQRLICEAMQIHNEMILPNKSAPTYEQFQEKLDSMSGDALRYLAVEIIKTLPEEYKSKLSELDKTYIV